MVDIGPKPVTRRRAVATGEVALGAAAWKVLKSGRAAKGDVLGVARLAGIQAAKRTAELIPLCHPVALTQVTVTLSPSARGRCVRIRAEARCEGRTGVEMEVLVAVALAALTVYDMLKGVDRSITIGPIALEAKTGGKSGPWRRSGTA